MKKIAVIGASGNMGRRYAMILEQYTSCHIVRIDVDNMNTDISDCDGFIVATPTDTHFDVLCKLAMHQKPILCDKPLIKSRLKLKSLMSYDGLDISMINQYEFMINPKSKGHSYYNYFKTGGDGLLWDCMNIIGLAESSVKVNNQSVIWQCVINGEYLNITDMDTAYIDNIVSWVCGWRNKDYILKAHDKVWGMINDQESK